MTAGQVTRAVENFSLHTVDETIRRNVEFQGRAGLQPKVIRKAARGCCKWCSALAGTYSYPNVPQDVWRRHENCNCTVEYDPGDGRRQTVHTKGDAAQRRQQEKRAQEKTTLRREQKPATIKTKYAPSPQRQKKGLQVSHALYSRLTGTMNTQYPELKPEDGIKTIYDSNYSYAVQADGYGGLIILKRLRLK